MNYRFFQVSSALCALTLAIACGQMQQSTIPPLLQASSLSGSSLLYVLGKFEGRKLSVYSFPEGEPHKHVLMPTGGGEYICSDHGGNVYAPTYNVIFKYAHGGQRPIAYLQDKGALGPECAGDPKTGNLLAGGPGGIQGCRVVLYIHAKGSPRCIKAIDFDISHPSYDSDGDLFFYGEKNQNSLGELPAGASKTVKISLNKTVTRIWYLQWDGQDIAIQGKLPGTIDQPVVIERVHISGTKGTVVKTIRFEGWTDRDQRFWISGNLIIAPLTDTELGIWNYPQGGKQVGTITMPTFVSWTVSVSSDRSVAR